MTYRCRRERKNLASRRRNVRVPPYVARHHDSIPQPPFRRLRICLSYAADWRRQNQLARVSSGLCGNGYAECFLQSVDATPRASDVVVFQRDSGGPG